MSAKRPPADDLSERSCEISPELQAWLNPSPTNDFDRHIERTLQRFRDDLFPEQLAFYDDESEFVAALCTRQCGKNFTSHRLAIRQCLEHPRSLVLIINKTLSRVRKVCWDDPEDGIPAILGSTQVRDDGFRIGHGWIERDDRREDPRVPWFRKNDSNLTVWFPNESRIVLCGLDKQNLEALLGEKPNLVLIDEGQNHSDLERLVFQIIAPALAKARTFGSGGTVRVIGTPDPLRHGSNFHAYTREEPDEELTEKQMSLRRPWSVHRWGSFHNTKLPGIREEHLALKEKKGWSDDDPEWLTFYMGRWAVHEGVMMFPFPTDRWWVDLPGHPADWRCVGGLDYGTDMLALVLWLYSPYHEGLYELFSIGRPGLDADQMTELVRSVVDRCVEGDLAGPWGRPTIHCDHNAKSQAMAWDRRFNLRFMPADKSDKTAVLMAMHSDAKNGVFRFRTGSELEAEMSLVRREIDTKRGTISLLGQHHLSDAARYAYVECMDVIGSLREAPTREDTMSDSERLKEQTRRRLRRGELRSPYADL